MRQQHAPQNPQATSQPSANPQPKPAAESFRFPANISCAALSSEFFQCPSSEATQKTLSTAAPCSAPRGRGKIRAIPPPWPAAPASTPPAPSEPLPTSDPAPEPPQVRTPQDEPAEPSQSPATKYFRRRSR